MWWLMEVAMSPQFLTVDETADFLRCSSKWIYLNKEKIPGYFKLNGLIRFDRQLLESRLKELASRPAERAVRFDRHGL